MGKASVANPGVPPEGLNDFGLAYEVETTCGTVADIIKAALDSEELDDSPLIYAALEQCRTDLLRLQDRAIGEQQAAA